MRDENPYPSHSLSEKSLSDFLEEYETPGISGVDTRSLTLKLRRFGTLKGALATAEIDDGELLDMRLEGTLQPDHGVDHGGVHRLELRLVVAVSASFQQHADAAGPLVV